jgi:hypothetical protein
MASQGYYDWLRAGKPYTLIEPAKDLKRNIKQHGIVVYDYPDESHLKAAVPQHHTPFATLGYPFVPARWRARGLDVMPKSSSYAHRKENADIARQIIRDKNAGVPGTEWIYYINWTDENGVCKQHRWRDGDETVVSSSDRDHIHISGRSDYDFWDGADGYDPVARMHGQVSGPTTTTNEEDDMWFAKRNVDGMFLALRGGFAFPLGGVEDLRTYYRTNKANGIQYTGPKVGDGLNMAEWEQIWIDKDYVFVRLGFSEQHFGYIYPPKVTVEGGDVNEATVVAALESEAGQAALVKANETSEDG